MTSEQSIQSVNVAAATVLIELLLISMLATASSIYSRRSGYFRLSLERNIYGSHENSPLRRAPVLFITIVSLAVLMISDELYSIWSPLFQGVRINTISATVAISFVFLLNLILIGYLMLITGGSSSSPFISALFTVPALAIFLRLPPLMFISFAITAVFIYLLLLIPLLDSHRITPEFGVEGRRPSQAAAAFMNISCLLLSMFTGYITRPVPIDELQLTGYHYEKAVELGASQISHIPAKVSQD